MQIDMHYYATYAMAIAAGIPQADANIIAYASQFTDDSTRYNSGEHKDGGLLFGITTAHNPAQSAIINASDHNFNSIEARQIWIPFHFFPGGEGKSFQQKLLCTKNGVLIKELLQEYSKVCAAKPYGLELLGIAAHVYMDTFSHYGFSGISSSFNNVVDGSVDFVTPPTIYTASYIQGKFEKFVAAPLADMVSSNLGHAGAATYPDRPYLHWKLTFEEQRPGNGKESHRDNQKTFFEACQSLYTFFSEFCRCKYANQTQTSFDNISEEIISILSYEGNKEGRCNKWHISSLVNGMKPYDSQLWEDQKKIYFKQNKVSEEGISSHAYRFHQAAAFHRYYVLKDFLPAHGIAVY
ncbi:MAG: hypothetical protein PHN64_04670 [Desulfovibrionaceae bacterium]|nr:hypothetical protein [Desulfovibrionaceae bacterium]